MTKQITFNAKDVFGRNFDIMDTFNNVVLVQEGLDHVYKAIDKVDDEFDKKKQKKIQEIEAERAKLIANAKKKHEEVDEAALPSVENTTLPEPGFLDYSKAIVPTVMDEFAKLLGLNKEDRAKLDNLSYSVIQDTYAQACDEFTGIELPTVERMKKNLERMQAIQSGQASLDDGEEESDPK